MRLLFAKPLSESIMNYCQFDPLYQTIWKTEAKQKNYSFSKMYSNSFSGLNMLNIMGSPFVISFEIFDTQYANPSKRWIQNVIASLFIVYRVRKTLMIREHRQDQVSLSLRSESWATLQFSVRLNIGCALYILCQMMSFLDGCRLADQQHGSLLKIWYIIRV